MNVLLVYPAPPPSAWPKGAFRSRWIPSGLACIATVLRRGGHQVKIHLCEETLELNRYDRAAARALLQAQMQEFRPELVGLSLVSSSVPEAAVVAEDAKTLLGSQTLVMAGGPHPTALPEELLTSCPAIDAAVIGEGELTMLELADHGLSPSVNGIVFRRKGTLARTLPRAAVEDLDRLGPPAYDLFNVKHFTAPSRWLIRFLKLPATNLRTSRGCSHRCSFCAGHLVAGLGVRYHSIEYVLDQMRHAATCLGVTAIRFEDDTVGADRGRLLELCTAIRRAGLHKQLKWEACLRVNQADAEILAEMKAAGCIQVEYGFESGSTESLRRLGKQTDIELNRRAVELTRRAGLRIFADIMVGLPGETPEDFKATVRFLRWARPEIISAARLCPLPGTPIYNNLDPAVRSKIGWEDFSYPDSQVNPVNLTAMPDR
ncbi:MAG: radical SAM protein [Verrucomicrobiota bacterium]|jgi:radical SAM superfamily enzyme YgiQ (UPF0313 family)